MMRFTNKEVTLIEGALRIAMEQYERDANIAANNECDSIARQFDLQARQARQLLADIEAFDPDAAGARSA